MKNNSRLKLYFYLTFVLFVFFSFIFVPKERARKSMKEAKIVDYVLFSQENFTIKKKIIIPENPRSFSAIYAAKLLAKGETHTNILNPYYKIRYDIIARNIILFGSLLSGIFIVIRIKQIKI